MIIVMVLQGLEALGRRRQGCAHCSISSPNSTKAGIAQGTGNFLLLGVALKDPMSWTLVCWAWCRMLRVPHWAKLRADRGKELKRVTQRSGN